MAAQTLKELHTFVVEAIGRLNCIDATDPKFGEQVDEELNDIEGQIAAMLAAELPTSTEERERIGNLPTCDECGEQHSQDLTCEESAEMTACDPKQ